MSKSPSKKPSSSSSGVWLSPMTVSFLVVVLAVALQWSASIPSLTGPPSSRKPYATFQHFYPFYASEHQNETNRKLHFTGTSVLLVLFLLHPRSVPSLLFAACCGYMLCPLLRGLDHGFFEFGLTIAVFLGMHKISTGKLGLAALIPIIGYTFAWVGHFHYELNRPATFIYPVFSLMGDFYMWARIITGVESF